MTAALWVVMPAYNEAESLASVVHEWVEALRLVGEDFVLCVLNDGSTDATLAVAEDLATSVPELRVVDKPNSGHGQTCLAGYRAALASGAQWVLQIDSDGQCDPRWFPELWSRRTEGGVVYGYRRRRDDGRSRWLASRVVSTVCRLGGGVWVRDANVPYRLMHREALTDRVDDIPADFYLANILLAVEQQRHGGIAWVDIHFRDRIGGTPSIKMTAFARHGWKLFQQLRAQSAGGRGGRRAR